MCGLNRFRDDLDTVLGKMKADLEDAEYAQLLTLRDRLLELNRMNRVKINHSVMELICAMHLIKDGFEVELEHIVDKVLCDVYATKGYGTAIVDNAEICSRKITGLFFDSTR